jgi:hypothetical protein
VHCLDLIFLLVIVAFFTTGGRFTHAFSSSFFISLDLHERVELVKVICS